MDFNEDLFGSPMEDEFAGNDLILEPQMMGLEDGFLMEGEKKEGPAKAEEQPVGQPVGQPEVLETEGQTEEHGSQQEQELPGLNEPREQQTDTPQPNAELEQGEDQGEVQIEEEQNEAQGEVQVEEPGQEEGEVQGEVQGEEPSEEQGEEPSQERGEVQIDEPGQEQQTVSIDQPEATEAPIEEKNNDLDDIIPENTAPQGPQEEKITEDSQPQETSDLITEQQPEAEQNETQLNEPEQNEQNETEQTVGQQNEAELTEGQPNESEQAVTQQNEAEEVVTQQTPQNEAEQNETQQNETEHTEAEQNQLVHEQLPRQDLENENEIQKENAGENELAQEENDNLAETGEVQTQTENETQENNETEMKEAMLPKESGEDTGNSNSNDEQDLFGDDPETGNESSLENDNTNIDAQENEETKETEPNHLDVPEQNGEKSKEFETHASEIMVPKSEPKETENGENKPSEITDKDGDIDMENDTEKSPELPENAESNLKAEIAKSEPVADATENERENVEETSAMDVDSEKQDDKPAVPEEKVQEEEEEEESSSSSSSPESLNDSTVENAPYSFVQTHEIVIPSYSKWFDLRKIHEIEKKSLPEFFTNRIASKTPEVYVKYRNFMVNVYRLNPNEYFTVTAARRNISGDAAALFRIHKFLTKWGLINYQVDAKVLPKNVEPPFTGDYATRHDAPRGLFPFESYKPSVQLPDMAKLKKMMDVNDSESALYRYLKEEKRKFIEAKIENSSNQKETAASQPTELKKEEVNTEKADGVSGEQSNDSATLQRLHNLKRVQETAFNEEHKLKRPKILEDESGGWKKEEIQKLLDGIQKHGVDWYKVASDVGTKTPEQCILKFLQLPIEDKFLYKGEGGKDLGPIKFAPHLPFSKSENPVLSTIAFLVGLVDPQIVKNMTNRAIQKIEDVHEQNLKNTKNEAKEGSEIALASLGVRSGIYANNEEKHLHALSHKLVQVQIQKLEAKLELLNRMEKTFDLEKKLLEKQQETLLMQRLQAVKNAKSVADITSKIIEDIDGKEELKKHLETLKEQIANPLTPSFAVPTEVSKSTTTLSEPKEVKPVSIEAPQYYRYWSA